MHAPRDVGVNRRPRKRAHPTAGRKSAAGPRREGIAAAARRLGAGTSAGRPLSFPDPQRARNQRFMVSERIPRRTSLTGDVGERVRPTDERGSALCARSGDAAGRRRSDAAVRQPPLPEPAPEPTTVCGSLRQRQAPTLARSLPSRREGGANRRGQAQAPKLAREGEAPSRGGTSAGARRKRAPSPEDRQTSLQRRHVRSSEEGAPGIRQLDPRPDGERRSAPAPCPGKKKRNRGLKSICTSVQYPPRW